MVETGLIKIENINELFDAYDLFAHRTALASVLSDREETALNSNRISHVPCFSCTTGCRNLWQVI